MKRLLLFFTLLPIFNFAQSNQYQIDSMLHILSTSKSDTNKVNLLGELSFLYSNENIEQAIVYGEQRLTLAKSLNWEKGIAASYNALGNCYTQKFDSQKALDHYFNAIKYWEKLGNTSLIARAYTNIGIVYQNENNLPSSLANYFKALQMAEELKDEELVAFEQANIGSLYQIIGDYQKAIDYNAMSMIYFKKVGNLEEVAGNYVGIGNAQKSLGNLNKALESMLEGLKIYTDIKYQYGKALSLVNIATVYDAQHKYQQALQYQHDALVEFTAMNDENGIAISQLQMGDYYYKIALDSIKIMNHALIPSSSKACLTLAISYLQKAIPVLLKQHNLSDLSSAYKVLADAQRANGNYQEAIESYLNYNLYKDSVYSIETAKKINTHENQREIDLRESKIKLLAQDLKLKNIHAQKQQLTKNALIGGIIFIIIICGMIVFYFKRKQQNDKLLAHEKINTLLKDQELQSVSNMLEVQEQERKRIAADLHDRLGSMLSTVKLYFNSVEEQIDHLKTQNREQYSKATSLLDEACDEVRKISHNLVSGELIKFGLVSALNQLKETMNETGKISVQLLSFGMEQRLESATEISLYRVVQELMNNMLKHSKASEVIIQLNRVENNLNIVVEDNGIGFDYDAALLKNGMGLRSVETRVQQLNGTISFDTGKGRGTTTIIDIPVKSNV